MRTKPTNPHDRLFRALVQRPDLGPELVRSCLPQQFAELLADRPIERVPDNIIDQEMRLHQCDCLFRIPAIDGSDQDVYVLIERKSDIDWTVPFKVNRNVAFIRDWGVRQESASPELYPLVIPILLYHGGTKWNGPLSFLQIRKPPEEYLPLFAPMGLFLRDLKNIRFQALADHPGVRSGLAALKHSRDDEFPNLELRLILSGRRGDGELETQVGGYIVDVCNLDRERFEEAWQAIIPERRKLMGTLARELIRTGEAGGRAKGQAETLLRLLHRRFGPLPESVEARIRASVALDVDAWIDTVLEAKSVDDVLAAAGSR